MLEPKLGEAAQKREVLLAVHRHAPVTPSQTSNTTVHKGRTVQEGNFNSKQMRFTALEVWTATWKVGGGWQHMHKNLLQQYTQRSGIYLPSYSTFNEGEPHVPRFRATVVVDGMTITSPNTFSHLKDAEQDVAKLALECISVKFKNEGSYYIHKDPVFCKLILNEYGVKLKIDKPTYNTIQQRGLLSTFVSTVSFDGKTYVGFTGKSKKEAEQNAACTVIDSILANSNACNAMAQVIKTKANLFAAMDCNATVGNASITSGAGTDSAHDVNTGLELVTVSNNGSVPVGSSSWVPYTSPWVNTAHNNQVNYQIPSLGLPLAMNDPHSIISKKRSKRAKKKRQGNQPKRVRVDEQ
ncbi:Double-stranded RNA-binding protein 2 [Platanthera guangdongensis]|uniref:Double-stranded RNA-binding protein 2 n=1 Tax=Platanthera guangdongensis TaxID=2320717 RepID=A0ABR2LJZ0_9ASPA